MYSYGSFNEFGVLLVCVLIIRALLFGGLLGHLIFGNSHICCILYLSRAGHTETTGQYAYDLLIFLVIGSVWVVLNIDLSKESFFVSGHCLRAMFDVGDEVLV